MPVKCFPAENIIPQNAPTTSAIIISPISIGILKVLPAWQQAILKKCWIKQTDAPISSLLIWCQSPNICVRHGLSETTYFFKHLSSRVEIVSSATGRPGDAFRIVKFNWGINATEPFITIRQKIICRNYENETGLIPGQSDYQIDITDNGIGFGPYSSVCQRPCWVTTILC